MAHDMAHDAQLRALEDGLRAQDPRFSEAMDAGQPCTPREYRRGRAWLLLLAGLTALGAGIGIGHGLLLATGLVVAGLAVHLFDPDRPRPRGLFSPG
ncbi:DUF3040 domain-containing protein [Streptomyces albidoflavus]|uniref:DUF3040 domain-containing protein n=1 Tax=Streptomyces albidoflavus TaxID=1886 RepID=UPI00074384AA|nr:DUF3040 domain-containing protein [Streptomyces albidoflavus]KUL58069.1 hypothetical protein ADL32_24190 [Streptomyces albidoflavus]RZE67141.1 DUF3040 domain-containing protein [Streptomyces albidoflavus]WSD56836.1 DUF3040 domain-containing protein [Streptomyces albidoflavus]SCD69408.1 Protein of unknown function [Streptomyces sp. IgraMP-1]